MDCAREYAKSGRGWTEEGGVVVVVGGGVGQKRSKTMPHPRGEIGSTASQHPPPLTRQPSEFRSCVKVEVAVLGSQALISLKVSLDVKQHSTQHAYSLSLSLSLTYKQASIHPYTHTHIPKCMRASKM